MKYIKVELKGCETIIIFPEYIQHIEMANRFGGADHVLSAGSCLVKDENAQCYGKSVSLEKKSNDGEDTLLLKRQLASY